MQNEPCDILLVEDNPDDEELALIAMEEAGITQRIFVVRDGKEAIDYIFCEGTYSQRHIQDQPRLIMLDIKLPLISEVDCPAAHQRRPADPGVSR